MPYFAKVKNDQVLCVYEFTDAVHAWEQAVDDEAIYQINESEFKAWLDSRKATWKGGIIPVTEKTDFEQLKTNKLIELDKATAEFIYSRFPKQKQADFNWMLMLAISESRTDIANQVKPVFKWIASVLNYHYQIKEAIEGATSESVLETIKIDFDQFRNGPEVKLKDIVRRFNGNETK